jgi:hypothetical protein
MNLLSSLFAILSRNKKTLLLIFVVSTVTLLISSAISIWLSNFHNLTVPTVGTIKTVGVEAYWDPNRENRTETIDWGTLWPGLTRNATLYIRSVSNVKTTLNLSTSDSVPAEVSEYLNLSWDYSGALINPDGTIQVTLFLSATRDESFIRYLIDNHVTNFSINIHIVAHE